MATIKTRGKSTPSRTQRTSTAAKPRRASATPARKRTAKAAAPARQQRARTTNMSEAKLQRLLDPIRDAAQERNEYNEAWLAAVGKVAMLVLKAMNAEVPIGMVAEAADMSRQQIYKIERDIEEGRRNEKGVSLRSPGRPKENGESNGARPGRKVSKPARSTAKAAPAKRARTKPAPKAASKPTRRVRLQRS